ncbi:Putative Signal transduction histidine kinase(Signal transduction histidine kinase, subgroup 2, dimerisation and phosphoacceptor domain,361-436;ATPase-like, ATP-binding domain,421-547) [Magnetospirillum sp. XM-1]|uniref:sensor histidine kinase n=1 Tax=Magnetospirillum sp. XM-1 TaxID=1663591 RepID=UPI00073DDD60|nr:histidine kinase dimerization/phosphoacceptor domain -containing protein [Magnetospirillum sp. XM-1]CUW38506.1 Putative Signal transduction histidine kinase(Signal transduction histidine kinase, subgroup 2, dimerisation and phosphoacceptor domain,361-436;ATPase-like, ATP-binding domain,421-547) [Magnetospirillum sp. XM-1]
MNGGSVDISHPGRTDKESDAPRPSRLPQPRLLLGLITAIAVLGGMAGLGTLTWFDHQVALADWTANLSLSARLVESHTRAAYGTAHANLGMVGDHVAGRPLASLRNSRSEQQWLASVLGSLPYGIGIAIHDERGDPVLAHDSLGLFAANAAHRDHFIVALAQPGRTVMSAVVPGRGDQGRVIIFSRAIQDPTGRTVGVAQIALKTDYFIDFYRDLQPDPGSIFLVSRLDGGLVARYPMPDATFTRFDTSKAPFTHFAKAPSGLYRSASVVDGIERLVAYRNLPDLDMVVTSGIPTELAFREWSIRTRRNVLLFATAMALLLVLAAITGESLRHEARLLATGERRTRELINALAEKDVLFQEVHHRVKNNLQVISSLLTMQSLHVTDEKVKETLKDALDRIHSMGLVHQTLYERNLASNVDLGTYFGKLAEALAGSYSASPGGVTVEVEVEGTLDLERAVPLGMLANEVLSNAMKHAFSDGRRGTIWVTLVREAGEWHFTVRDNGVGMPDKPGRGIGIGLIRALARQLGGRSHILVDEGTVVSVTFPA